MHGCAKWHKYCLIKHNKECCWVCKIELATRIFEVLPEEFKVDLGEVISGVVVWSVFGKNKVGYYKACVIEKKTIK